MAYVFTVIGRIIDRRGVGVGGVRVEAWDADALIDDLVGVAETDQVGRFEIRFTRAYFGDLLERKPDLYFKVLRRGDLLCDTRGRVLRNVSGDAEVVIRVGPEGALPAGAPSHVVRGQVLDHRERPVEYVDVQAWDKDRLADDFVGSASTDRDGRFEIRIDAGMFQELFVDRRPDLFFKVLDEDRLLLDTEADVGWNAPAGDLEVTLRLPRAEEPPSSVEVSPRTVVTGERLRVAGSHWRDCPVTLQLDGRPLAPLFVARGESAGPAIQPDGSGAFEAVVMLQALEPGRHELAIESRHLDRRVVVPVEVRPHAKDEKGDRPIGRQLDFFNRRFAHLGFVPPGTRVIQVREVEKLRRLRDERAKRPPGHGEPMPPSNPSLTACNWTPLGPTPVRAGTVAFSGRALAVAIHPGNHNLLLLGTAGGGVWKSADGGLTWSGRSDYRISLAIGALAFDPVNPSRVFAGTGEYNSAIGTYYGNGLLFSSDAGDSWSDLATSFFPRAEINRILFDTTDSTSQRMFLSSTIGVWQSSDGGNNWTSLRAGTASDLVMLIDTAAGTLQLIAGFANSGLWTSTRTAGPGPGFSWSAWTQITSTSFPASFTRIALGQCPGTPRTIYAAFSNGSGLAGMARTTTGGSSWASVAGPASGSGQTFYNFHITVHPTAPDTVYYGEVNLWKTTTGGAPWTNTSVLHSDQHALGFDPTDAQVVWAVNDGGIYRSGNGGGSWEHRNRDLATLEHISVAVHPQYDAVLLAGAQDNGTERYSGSPVWESVDGGDGGFTAIDPSTPTRMYHGYVRQYLYRSANAGSSWVEKTGAITGPDNSDSFYPPFTLDPSSSDICYFGYDAKVWRAPDDADTWTAIASGLNGQVSALVVHPTDSSKVYAATTTGRVYRLDQSGSTWTLNDLTGTGTNATFLNLWISDLAVAADGTLWITTSSILWTERTGEFTNDHVYRRLSSGTTWASRSTGLAIANPINSITIDPGAPSGARLFCAGDVGIFRTENSGGQWDPWDEGLPNAPVFDLDVHGPSRLLRAATHGRGVWERPIDTASCPMVDVYMRDNILDTGRQRPSPENLPHPFTPSVRVWHWQSEDIKVDAKEPTFQTTAAVTDYVAFETLQHRSTRRDRTNRFYVRVHNRGVNAAHNVRVRAFFADAHLGLPPLPSNFWTGTMPFSGAPAGSSWTSVGSAVNFPLLEPGEPGLAEWDFFVPTTANQHSCILAVATCDEEALDGGAILNADQLVRERKQVVLKNLEVLDAVPGSAPGSQASNMLEARAPDDKQAGLASLVFHWGSLPRDARVHLVLERVPDQGPALVADDDTLARAGVRRAAAELSRAFEPEVAGRCGEVRRFDVEHVYELSPAHGEQAVLPVKLPAGRSLALLWKLSLPGDAAEEAQLDVVQEDGAGRVVGGFTYRVRPRR